MTNVSIDKLIMVEADTLEEARDLMKSQLPEDARLISERIISDGQPKIIKAAEDTTEKAYEKTQDQIPKDADILERKQITFPEQKVITIEAFDEQSAESSARNQARYLLGGITAIKSLKLTAAGSKGVMGIGIKPNLYEAEIIRQAEIEITYKAKAKISGMIRDISKLVTCLKDYDLDSRSSVVDTLDKLGWQPDDGETGAIYWIEKRQWDKCLEIGVPAVGALIFYLRSSQPYARENAARALGRIGDLRAFEPLIANLNDAHLAVCKAAVEALGQMGKPAIEPLISVLKSSRQGWEIKVEIVMQLVKLGMDINDPLVRDTIQELITRTSKPDETEVGFNEDWKKIDDTRSYEVYREEAAAHLERVIAYWISKGETDSLLELDFQTSEETLIQSLKQNLGWRIKGQIAAILVKHGMSLDNSHLQETIQELRKWEAIPDGKLESGDQYIEKIAIYQPQRIVANSILNSLT
jgi:hypothetical protein